MAMTISKRVVMLASLGLAGAAALGIAGYGGSRNINTGIERMTMVSGALRHHMEADMMHDALRADVLAGLAAKDEQAHADVDNDLAEHVKNIREALTANASADLSDTARQALTDTMPTLDAYIAAARQWEMEYLK